VPSQTDLLYIKPGQLFDSTSNTPLDGKSCAS
jgi:hypothetical protein